MNKQADEFRRFIETEVLKILKKLSDNPDFSAGTLEQIAGLTLELVRPGMTIEELYRNAVKLDDRNPELAPVVQAIMATYEKHYEGKVLAEVSNLIKSGKYDDAQDMVKKVLEYKISS